MQKSTTYSSDQISDLPSGEVSGAAGLNESFFTNYTLIAQRSHHTFYKARRFGRWYVLKGLNEELRGNVFYEEWLLKEYSIGVRLDHPNVVRVESIETDAIAGKCIVMEYVEGDTLDRWLRRKPSLRERKNILNQLLDAVSHCHSRNVYHHDLKPSNIMVTDDLRVKLIDFGLSDGPQYAAFKQCSGTENYAAPEQANGDVANHRADIYALGKLIGLILPHRYRKAVRKALNSNPDRRQQSVDELRHMLHNRWWRWVLIVLAIAGLLYLLIRPSQRIRSIRLDSGQTCYYRVLENFPHPRVEFTYPGTEATPWPDNIPPLSGKMVLPESIRLNGINYRVSSIRESAFESQYGLTEVILPKTVNTIKTCAFLSCCGLKDTLYIPQSLTYIYCGAFHDCASITTLIWQADSCSTNADWGAVGHEYINSFYRCFSLRTVVMTENVRHLPQACFKNSFIKTAIFADGVEDLPSDLFAVCPMLDSIRWPATLRTIGHGAFYQTAFRTLRFPDATEVFSNYAFAYNPNIRRIEFGSKVKYIGIHTFSGCTQLKEVTIHAPVPPQVQPTSFEHMPSTAILRVPKESVDAYQADKVWSQFRIKPLP